MNQRFLLLAAAALAACAPRPGATRSARLRDLLDAHHFESTCDKIWPSALAVAAERGYAPGEARGGAGGGGGRREVDTGAGADGRRFRIQADDDAVGCHVAYLPLAEGGGAGEPDTDLALALVRKVEPQTAQGREAAASRGPPARRVGDSPRARY